MAGSAPGSEQAGSTIAVQNASTEADGATTPDAKGKSLMLTANTAATTVTNLTNGYAGQVVTIRFNDSNTTVAHNSTIKLRGGANRIFTTGTTLTLISSSSVWYEIGSSDGFDVIETNLLTSGESSLPRDLATSAQTLTSGNLRLRFFTARKTEDITKVRTYTGNTAAGATPTLCRVGIYSVDSGGDLTLVASIVNDTALWAGTQTAYERSLSATWSKVAGQRYAVGALCVTGATAPLIAGALPSSTGLGARPPRTTGLLSGQTDLPSPITAGSIGDSAASIFVEMIP
jgi:hypothetical protein